MSEPTDPPLRTDPPSAWAALTAPPELPAGLDPTMRALLASLQWERSNATTHLMALMQSQAQHNERRSQQMERQIGVTEKLVESSEAARREQLERHAELLQWLSDAGVKPSSRRDKPGGPGLIEQFWRRLPPAAQSGVAMSLGGAIGTLMLMLAGAAVEAITGRQVPMPTVPTISVPAPEPSEVPT